jgi:hypothetical protein
MSELKHQQQLSQILFDVQQKCSAYSLLKERVQSSGSQQLNGRAVITIYNNSS